MRRVAKAEENLERAKKLFSKAASDGVSEKELVMAKRKIASHILLASERTDTRMFSVGTQWLNNQPFKTPAQIADVYENVKLDEVNAALQKYHMQSPMTIAVGPKDEWLAV